MPCTKYRAPAGFKRAGIAPQDPTCAFESKDAYVALGPGLVRTFDQLQQFVETQAKNKGVKPPVLKQVAVDGWTFAAAYPEVDGFNRLDRYLVDSSGRVIVCKVGVDGKVDASTQAAFCDAARDLQYKVTTE